MALLRFIDLTLGYGRHPAVHHLSGDVMAGDLLAIIGPNGAGKSTLLKGLMGFLTPLTGRVEHGDGLGPRDFAYLPQAADIDRRFPITVYDLIAMGDWRRSGAFGGFGTARAAAMAEAIAAVGMTGFEDRGIGTLSGGQLQRALFARLMLQDARVILLDEPFSAIDQATTADMVRLIQRWNSEGRTVLAALHDLEMVRRAFPRTLLLAREPVAWASTADALTEANLRRARGMIEAFDPDAEHCAR
jgi:zinc/manganese transport system ATP-binding protein